MGIVLLCIVYVDRDRPGAKAPTRSAAVQVVGNKVDDMLYVNTNRSSQMMTGWLVVAILGIIIASSSSAKAQSPFGQSSLDLGKVSLELYIFHEKPKQMESVVLKIWNNKPWTPELVSVIAPYLDYELDHPSIKADEFPPNRRTYADIHPFYAIARDVGIGSMPPLISNLASKKASPDDEKTARFGYMIIRCLHDIYRKASINTMDADEAIVLYILQQIDKTKSVPEYNQRLVKTLEYPRLAAAHKRLKSRLSDTNK